MAWIYLLMAGILEICWAIGLKYSDGFKKPLPTIFTIIAMALSMYLLAKAVENLPIGTAYAIWVGIGAVGAAIFGIILFDESASAIRLTFIGMMLIAIIGLKITS